METQTLEEIKFLSTDLRGYEKYLKIEGYTDRYIGFLTLAPRLLFDLYGSRASINFLKDPNFRLNFLDIIRPRYQAGTLKKYSSGIGRYREYLVSAELLEVCKKRELNERQINKKQTYKYYDENKNPYYEKIESIFADYITIEMEYCKSEIRKKMGAFKKFVSYLIENKVFHLGDVNGQHILNFGSQKTTHKTDWNKLKCFLIFAFRDGYIKENFAGAIISKKKNRKVQRKYLGNDKIDEILSSIDRSIPEGKKVYAMYLLTSRLALRPCETIRIKYEDINWIKPELFIRGKNGSEDTLPLPNEVALAIFDYLKSSERGKSGYVFVCDRPPHFRLKNTDSLLKELKKAFRTTGIKPPTGKARLNVFRHSWATNTLNSEGNNFYKVQSILRHKSSEMTRNYAKYHSKKLSLFEAEWPESESRT